MINSSYKGTFMLRTVARYLHPSLPAPYFARLTSSLAPPVNIDSVIKLLGATYFRLVQQVSVFGMAAMPLLCNGTLLFQSNLPRVMPVTIYKYASCFIPYMVSFLILCGEWSSLVLKDFFNPSSKDCPANISHI